MKIASIILGVMLTLAVGWAEWTLVAQPQDFTPHWTIASVQVFLLVVWAVLFMRLRSPFRAIWAFTLLVIVTYAMVGIFCGIAPNGLPDWTLFPILGGVTLAWLLLLRIRIPDPWEATKRVAHALVWIWLSLLAAAIPASVYSALTEHSEPLVSAVVFAALLVGSAVLSIYAIRGRWSLTWPLLVLFVLTCPFGALLVLSCGFDVSISLMIAFYGVVIGLIGLGKLIVWAVGRGRTLAAPEAPPPVVGARPRGLVESVNHE